MCFFALKMPVSFCICLNWKYHLFGWVQSLIHLLVKSAVLHGTITLFFFFGLTFYHSPWRFRIPTGTTDAITPLFSGMFSLIFGLLASNFHDIVSCQYMHWNSSENRKPNFRNVRLYGFTVCMYKFNISLIKISYSKYNYISLPLMVYVH